MGRKRLPDATKAMRGTLRPERTGNVDLVRPDGCPSCPHPLGDIAQREWDRVAPDLWQAGLLTVLDLTALCVYCQSHQDFQRATAAIAEFGATYTTESGHVVQRPEVAMQNRAAARVAKFGAMFGLSPASRSGLKVAPPKLATGKGGKKSMAEKYLSPAVLPIRRGEDSGNDAG